VEAVDTTGAGDLFTAAYAWADLNGASSLESLRWAVLHAALSVRVPTAIAGAATRDELVAAAAQRGIAATAPRRGEAVTSTKEEA
jgi:sugar/nucleoside kinase (ribokinase family)